MRGICFNLIKVKKKKKKILQKESFITEISKKPICYCGKTVKYSDIYT
jgi:hypothetical protein